MNSKKTEQTFISVSFHPFVPFGRQRKSQRRNQTTGIYPTAGLFFGNLYLPPHQGTFIRTDSLCRYRRFSPRICRNSPWENTRFHYDCRCRKRPENRCLVRSHLEKLVSESSYLNKEDAAEIIRDTAKRFLDSGKSELEDCITLEGERHDFFIRRKDANIDNLLDYGSNTLLSQLSLLPSKSISTGQTPSC